MLAGQDSYRAGLAYLEAGQLDAAEQCFRAVTIARPNLAAGHYNLGIVLRERSEWAGAEAAFRSAIKRDPNYARAHVGLGSILEREGKTAGAEREFRKAISLDPQLEDGYLFLANLLRGKLNLRGARHAYESLLARFPDDAEARFGRGFLSLLEGDFESGWKDYEYRSARRGLPDRALTPQWRGENPAGKTLLLYSEQGIGDAIQFLRYAPILAEKGARVLAAVPVSVMELASRIEGVHEIVPPTTALPRFDFCVPLPSLPLYCGTTSKTIPWKGAYVSPPPGLNFNGPASDTAPGVTVALAWAGNPQHPNDHNRSLDVRQIMPLFEMPHIRWLILQRGAGASELNRMNRANIVQLGDTLTDFSQIASVICSADVLITVDTSFCHLGGALGKTVWTLLSYLPDWRWQLERSDSPWYPSMRLFRQPSPGNWAAVIANVSSALAAWPQMIRT